VSLRCVVIRPARKRDQKEFLSCVRRSRRLHRPWVSPPNSPEAFQAFLAWTRRPSHEGFLVCLHSTGEIVGVIHLNEVVRGCFQSAYLGYCAFSPHAGRGYMTEGLGLVLTKAFRELKLHRLEANIQPLNRASIRLVRRLGFRKEGLSPRYLKIRGQWQDHERWAILAEEWRSERRSECRRSSSSTTR